MLSCLICIQIQVEEAPALDGNGPNLGEQGAQITLLLVDTGQNFPRLLSDIFMQFSIEMTFFVIVARSFLMALMSSFSGS